MESKFLLYAGIVAFTARPLLPLTFTATPWNSPVLTSIPPYRLLPFARYACSSLAQRRPRPWTVSSQFFLRPLLATFPSHSYQHLHVLTPGFSAASAWQPPSPPPILGQTHLPPLLLYRGWKATYTEATVRSVSNLSEASAHFLLLFLDRIISYMLHWLDYPK